MKIFGALVIFAGFMLIVIGFTGSQHKIMQILKGVHFSPNPATAKANASPKVVKGKKTQPTGPGMA